MLHNAGIPGSNVTSPSIRPAIVALQGIWGTTHLVNDEVNSLFATSDEAQNGNKVVGFIGIDSANGRIDVPVTTADPETGTSNIGIAMVKLIPEPTTCTLALVGHCLVGRRRR